MKRITCFLALFIVPGVLLGQEIRGIVVDSFTGKPLGSVNVYLHRTADSVLVTGAVTESTGTFTIAGIPPGHYFLRFSLLSYGKKTLGPVRVAESPEILDVGSIGLKERPVDLNEVVARGEKMLMNQDIDRKVYNVEKDIAAVSGSVSDLLRNIPSVEVDLDGNVSLRGSQDVVILVNGKNSPLMGRNQAEVIQQMPANSIERIEVITNPSARYRPDGTAGIINLELKKTTENGFNGSTTANAGLEGRYGGNLRLNVRPGATNIFGNYSLRNDARNRFNSDFRVLESGTPAAGTFLEEGSSTAKPRSHMGTLGIEHEMLAGTTVTASGTYFLNQMTMAERTSIVQKESGVLSHSTRVSGEGSSEEELEFRAGIDHKFPGERHELRLEIQGSREREEERTLAHTLYAGFSDPSEGERVSNTQVQRSTEITADYVRPMGEDARLEAGYTAELTGFDINAMAESFTAPGAPFAVDPSLTNHFLLDQTLHALYATFRQSFGPVGVMGGIRGEQVFRTSNLVTLGTLVKSDYASLYPSLHVSYKALPRVEVQVNYSRRTHRPHAHELNPFPEYRDPRNISVGNPHLLPEYINSFELGCKVEHELFVVVPSLYYRYTNNRFSSVVRPLNDSTLISTQENLAEDRSAGVEIVCSGGIQKVFSITASWNGFRNQIDASNLGFSSPRAVWSWSGSMTFSVNLSTSTRIQVNGNYRSARLTPQGSYSPTGIVNLGVRQDFWNRNLTATLTLADALRTMRRELILDAPGFTEHSFGTRDSRILLLSLTYRFGDVKEEDQDEQMRYDETPE